MANLIYPRSPTLVRPASPPPPCPRYNIITNIYHGMCLAYWSHPAVNAGALVRFPVSSSMNSNVQFQWTNCQRFNNCQHFIAYKFLFSIARVLKVFKNASSLALQLKNFYVCLSLSPYFLNQRCPSLQYSPDEVTHCPKSIFWPGAVHTNDCQLSLLFL